MKVLCRIFCFLMNRLLVGQNIQDYHQQQSCNSHLKANAVMMENISMFANVHFHLLAKLFKA